MAGKAQKVKNRGPPRQVGDFFTASQLTEEEFEHLRSQIVISSWGGRRYPPYAFTEQGIAMLSGVLRGERAVQVNIEIMRTFARLRQMLASDKELAKRLDELERKYDEQFRVVFDAMRQLMEPADPEKKPSIGFIWNNEEKDK
uniref:ORF6N domain-containing protein n=1 Tax=Candidatus Kentrum eta TaxID=2126337 RepID=A0A450UTE7_9GAMM|nr:MAG: ORF6N domain-containing protein [Candidatus Kentron sp. H]VFJ89050.1 MAG: ORF6N domain-containing protein [Candidatus Kentron sp. H]VFJ95746.1 MAG: ORF6N domain-containing protein [Candidatus Kentron sp. H]